MLLTFALIFAVLWLIGVVTGAVFGGVVHVLLGIAIVLFIVDLLGRGKP